MSYIVMMNTPIALTSGKKNKPERGWKLGVSSDAWGLCEENDRHLSMMSYRTSDTLPEALGGNDDFIFHLGINLKCTREELRRALKELGLV